MRPDSTRVAECKSVEMLSGVKVDSEECRVVVLTSLSQPSGAGGEDPTTTEMDK